MNIIKRKSKLIYMLLFCFLYIVFAIYFGAIPGLGYPVEPNLIGNVGSISEFGNYINNATNVSFPYGLFVSEGFGIVVLGDIFGALGCNAILGVQLGFLAVYTVSFFCMKKIAECISGSSLIAAICLTLFYFDPFLVAQRGIPYIIYGSFMLPAVILIEYKCYKELFIVKTESTHQFSWVMLITDIIVKLVAVSMGWYTAVISAVGTCAFWLIYIVQQIYPKKTLYKHSIKVYVLYIVLPWIIAMLVILAITPTTVSNSSFTVDNFLANAVDSATLFIPSNGQLISCIFPTANDLMEGQSLTGDGTMWSNYLGLIMLIAMIYLLFSKGTNRALIRTIAIVSFIGLILSLGPGVKLLAGVDLDEVPQYSYALDNVLAFPWAKAFTKVFPLTMMRATYRWIILTKIALIFSFAIFVNEIRRSHKKIAFLLAFFAIVEFLPTKATYLYNFEALDRLQETYASSVDSLVEWRDDIGLSGEETATFLTYDYSSNAFLMPFIAYETGFNSYTGAGDKSLAVANKFVPKYVGEIQSQSNPEALAKLITQIGEQQSCDFIIFPYFDLREQNSWWPPNFEKYERTKEIAQETENILADYEIPVWDLTYYKIFDLREFNKSCIKEQEFILESEGQYMATLDVSDKKRIYLYGMAEILDGAEANTTIQVELRNEKNEIFASRDVTELTDEKFVNLEQEYEIPDGTRQVSVSVKTKSGVSSRIIGLIISAVDPNMFYANDEMRILSKYGVKDIQSFNNITIDDDCLKFDSDSQIKCESLLADRLSSFEISMDILVQTPDDPNSVNLISKEVAWANTMSFCMGMKEEKSFLAISQDGQTPYLCWYDNSLIDDEKWHNLRFAFDKGEIRFYIDEELIIAENCGFESVYNVQSTLVQIGGGFSGKIKNILWELNSSRNSNC